MINSKIHRGEKKTPNICCVEDLGVNLAIWDHITVLVTQSKQHNSWNMNNWNTNCHKIAHKSDQCAILPECLCCALVSLQIQVTIF